VTKDVPDYALVVGNPAKIICWMCECGQRLAFTENAANFSVCEKQYIKNNQGSSFEDDEKMIVKFLAAG
jgi:UDP-2-acetamido-3-amino-2,3-dideoxy-glucuronate N-acetyltransferase